MVQHVLDTDVVYEINNPLCKACRAPVNQVIGIKNNFRILRCSNCQSAQVDPFPTEKDLAEYYENYGKTFDYERKAASKLRRAKRRIGRIMRQKPPGNRFLDVGCSLGFTTKAARDAGLDAKGVDVDTEVIKSAKKQFGDYFETIAIEKLAGRGDKFDVAYANEVIEHVRDPDSFVAAVSRLLVPGGIFYVTCPDGNHPRVPKDFASWGMVTPPDHLTYFSREGLRTLLARHGLIIEKFQISFKPGIKAFAVKRG